ncbi:MAG: ccr [Planctomycetota bacterium]|nr:ccr [Planctomycetota bacterium]
MKAIVLREIGSTEVLKLEIVPDPVAGPGEVVIRLEAAALNHRDVWIRKGMYAGIRFPAILGSDGAGQVVGIGDGVPESWVGRSVVIDPGLDWGDDPRVQGPNFRVLGMPDDGTYAELIRVPVANVHDRPEHLSALETAAIPLAGLTAYRALVTRAKLQAGETVLITGIGGGVSGLALQIAKALGATAFVTSRSEAKLLKAKELGADAGVNSSEADWAKKLVGLTGGEGPNVILDSVGGETFSRCLQIVGRGGRIVTYGATTGPVERMELTRVFWKQIDILGSTMGSPTEFAAMLELVSRSRIRPAVDRVFRLGDAGKAQDTMEQAGQFGKIVLEIAGS